MLFGVDFDVGTSIQCYLIPDAGGTTPSLRLINKGQPVAVVEANVVRPEVSASGRHSTGRCGFLIDEAMVGGLSAYDELELREAETGLVVYRRPRPGFLTDSKVFRLETHLLPLWRFDDAFQDKLQYWYKGIDRQGLETSLQVFQIHKCTSLYVSGRLQFQGIETYLGDFRSLVLLRDPFYELAERLLVLKNLPEDRHDILGARDVLTFKPVVDFLKEFESFDDKFCKNLMRWAPEDVLKILGNPVARQLSSSTGQDVPKKNALAAALQALSTFDVVGVRDDAGFFSRSVQEILDIGRPLPVFHEYKKVIEFGENLRNYSKVDLILEHDLEIFDHIKQAFASAGQHPVVS